MQPLRKLTLAITMAITLVFGTALAVPAQAEAAGPPASSYITYWCTNSGLRVHSDRNAPDLVINDMFISPNETLRFEPLTDHYTIYFHGQDPSTAETVPVICGDPISLSYRITCKSKSLRHYIFKGNEDSNSSFHFARMTINGTEFEGPADILPWETTEGNVPVAPSYHVAFYDDQNTVIRETVLANPHCFKASFAKASVNGVSTQVWTGTQLRPVPTVRLSGVTLIAGVDYRVSYGTNTSVGKGSVTIKPASGSLFRSSKKVTFKILPTATAIAGATVGVKSVTASWVAVPAAEKISKYQVSIRRVGARSWVTKTVKPAATSLTITKLKSAVRYDIRVRSYKTVSGKRYYSAWSPALRTAPVG